ncbi:DUF2520 domain-containing protein [candidate division WOR-3 bacterium]|nr:DUF2520 domain-containing protein [candidate division WOR-3 bacterium]
MALRFGLYGTGNLGLSIAAALYNAGEAFVGVSDTDPLAARRGADLLRCPVLPAPSLARDATALLFAVPDDRIASLYEELKDFINPESLLVHFSGALTSEVFRGPLRLSAHPAQTFPYPRLEKDAFKDVYFALEGPKQAVVFFRPLLERIGARTFVISREEKPLYHAMCVFASNLIVGLLEYAQDIGLSLGLSEEERRGSITRLALETVCNAAESGSLADALSGPLLRGDKDTIIKNLNSLEKLPAQKRLYRLLSRRLLDAARQRGVPEEKLKEIEELLL